MDNSKSNRRKPFIIRAKVKDIMKFSDGPSLEAASAAAVAIEAMRKIQAATGPGYTALDVIASAVPDEYRRNWAKKLLGKAA
ncbi:hypothetical protein ACWX0K_14790 [Nitrobacteraceae bacterium UC4446_H13]